MDIKKPANNKRRNRRIAGAAAAGVGVVSLGWFAFSLAQRPPAVSRDLVWDGEVRRTEFVHEVTASGSLYAPELRSVTNQSDGIVERVLVLAGETVEPDDVLVVLSSPNLLQELADAEAALAAAGATTKLNLQSAVNREDQARRRVDLLQAQLERYPMTLEAENRQAQAKIDRASRKVERLRERVSELEVRAGFAGVIQKID